jgi:hypothetical protein
MNGKSREYTENSNTYPLLPVVFNSYRPLTKSLKGEKYPTNAHKQFIIVLINSPACFGFQMPSSGCYNFLIYKLLQSLKTADIFKMPYFIATYFYRK